MDNFIAWVEFLKPVFEVAAFGSAALFILTRLLFGHFNAGMEISLDLERKPDATDETQDLLSVLVKLKRNSVGRLEIKDILIEVSIIGDSSVEPTLLRDSRVTAERKSEKRETGSPKLTMLPARRGVSLPPGDATQLSYLVNVRRNVPIRVDTTVLATRTGPWVGNPQWRASATSLPTSPIK